MIDDEIQLAQACADEMMSTDHAANAFGIRVSIVAPGAAETRMIVRQDMLNGHDTCHGGMIFSLADTAFAYACNSHNEAAVAAGASIHFLRPAMLGDELVAVARETHKGRKLGLYDVEVCNPAGQRVAMFRGRSAALGRPVIPENSSK